MPRKSKSARAGAVAVSLLYYYKGKAYKHVFENDVPIDMQDGKIILTGRFTVDEQHGITDK